VPAAVGLVVLSSPITALLFQHGRFDADDAALTSRMVAVYGSVVWAYIGLLIVHRGYYAIGDRITPVRIGMLAVTVNVALNLVLVWLLGGIGLAIGTAAATALQAGLATWKLQSRAGRLDWTDIRLTLVKTLFASGTMAAVCLVARYLLPVGPSLTERGLALGGPLMAGLAVYFAAAWTLRLTEPWELIGVRRGPAS
jgi:putative peptidoglycan lipid II flippase